MDGLSWPSAVIVNRREFIDGRCYRMHRRSKRTNRLSLLVVRICFANTIWQLANFFFSFFPLLLISGSCSPEQPSLDTFRFTPIQRFLDRFSSLSFSLFFFVLLLRDAPLHLFFPLELKLGHLFLHEIPFEIRSGDGACCSLLFPSVAIERTRIIADRGWGRELYIGNICTGPGGMKIREK